MFAEPLPGPKLCCRSFSNAMTVSDADELSDSNKAVSRHVVIPDRVEDFGGRFPGFTDRRYV